MLKIGNKPILEKIIDNFANAGFFKFYISTHYMADKIRDYFGDGQKWGVQIKYIHENSPLGTGGAIGLLPKNEINKPFFMMNGDLLTEIDQLALLSFHETNSPSVTMCVRQFENQVPFGVVEQEGSQLKAIKEKPIQKFLVNAGIYLVEPDLIGRVEANKAVDMPDLLIREINEGKKVSIFPVHEEWLDVGRIEDFKNAQNKYNS